jgi:hypothetical protein
MAIPADLANGSPEWFRAIVDMTEACVFGDFAYIHHDDPVHVDKKKGIRVT